MKKNILLIVEGVKTEDKFFKNFIAKFEKSFDVYCFETNIYDLYRVLKDEDFMVNIKDILIEKHPDKQKILLNDFAYTYLIFDCDAHHSGKNEKRQKKDIVLDNLKKLKEMVLKLNDETDPTIGKLYINYPMMESYRDCNSFFDDEYQNAVVEIDNIAKYKESVGEKKLHSKHVNKFTKKDFELLILQNIYKLNYMEDGIWAKPDYKKYLNISSQENILIKEEENTKNNNLMYVLNTSLFIIPDYFGNNKSFYDQLKP